MPAAEDMSGPRPDPAGDPVDAFGASDLVGRVLAVLLAAAIAIVAVAATVGWTVWVTGFLPGLGYVTVPMCLYVLSIVLIPGLGVVHRLWVSGSVGQRAETAKRAERDRLRTTLLHAPAPERPNRTVRSYELPDSVLRGETDEEQRRRRRRERGR